jgi:hypothetical protein
MIKVFPIIYLAGFALVILSAVNQGILLERSWVLIAAVGLQLKVILVIAPLLGMLLALVSSRRSIARAASTPFPRAAALTVGTVLLTAPVFILATACVFGVLSALLVGLTNLQIWIRAVGPTGFYAYYLVVAPSSGVALFFMISHMLKFPDALAKGQVVLPHASDQADCGDLWDDFYG